MDENSEKQKSKDVDTKENSSSLIGLQAPRDLLSEKLPQSCGGIAERLSRTSKNPKIKKCFAKLSVAQIEQFVESTLNERIRNGDKQSLFLLGQYYFETGKFQMSRSYFQRALSENGDIQAAFQLGVIFYDGLGVCIDMKKGLEFMLIIANMKEIPDHLKSLYYAAHYNIGRAHFQGHGAPRSEEKSLQHWMKATKPGDSRSSVLAQTALGYFYSVETTIGSADTKKAFYWHSEACGNGSIESQGALGVMYLHGIGVKQNWETAFNVLSEAGRRGNIYAQGNLCYFYYCRKMYTKCSHLALKLMTLTNEDLQLVSKETHCILSYIYKGISIAAFLLGRCMQRGLGVEKNLDMAKGFFSTSFEFDYDICCRFQNMCSQNLI